MTDVKTHFPLNPPLSECLFFFGARMSNHGVWASSFEWTHFDCHEWWLFSRSHYEVPIGCAIAYMVWVHVVPRMMKDVDPWKLRHSLALWNFLLAAFSMVGFVTSLRFVLPNIRDRGFQYMVCNDDVMFGGDDPKSGAACYGPMGWVMTAFMLSKIPELVDTFFLVIRKRPVIFLHWYHHLTVLLGSWYAYACANPSSIMFATVNYGVHSIMYTYYGLCVYTRALNIIKKPITALQLVQMVAGMSITFAAGYYHSTGVDCSKTYIDTHYFAWNLGLFGSYFLLFAQFYYDTYIAARRKGKVA